MKTEKMDPAQAFEANLLARLKPMNEMTARGTSAVQQFYSGATVFITGGSGFLSKQFIEKLFRATKIYKMFVLLRSKKGKSTQQRLLEMLQDPLYDMLRELQPDFIKKIVPVSGDVAELSLGLSDEDWNTITEQVDIVFHVAATTKFDETLRVATMINVRGTREALLLGKACKKLRSYVHVSTAYSHACMNRINDEVLEDFYKSPIVPSIMIQLAETVDESRLNDMTASLIKNWPNTYTFTKAVAEELVYTMGDDLPICVVRPAAVVCTKREPNPGWLDVSNLYGASGLFMGFNLGVIHTAYANTKNRMEFIPVDYVNNAIIAAGWETARKRAIGENKTNIYTLSPSPKNCMTGGILHDIVSGICRKYSSPMILGYGFAWITSNPILFFIYSWLLHLIPAYIIDGISIIIGSKRRFAKLAKKIYKMSKSLSFFLLNKWYFNNQNTITLFDSLSAVDQEIFYFDIKNIDWVEYSITWSIGLRKYILKDGLKGTSCGNKKQSVFKVLTYIILPLYFYCLFKIVCFALSFFTLFW